VLNFANNYDMDSPEKNSLYSAVGASDPSPSSQLLTTPLTSVRQTAGQDYQMEGQWAGPKMIKGTFIFFLLILDGGDAYDI
jgi:hypothetical protein